MRFQLFFVACAMVCCGCRPSPQVCPAPPPAPLAPAPAPGQVTETALEITPPDLDASPPEPPSEPDPPPVAENPPLEKPASVPVQLDRFVLFPPGGPLVVDLEVHLGKKTIGEAFARIVEQALAAADTDGDGRPMWREVLDSPRFKAGEFGNLPFNAASQEKQITDLYDQDKDGTVDRDEVPRFLTRNAGGSRPFSFRGTTEWRNMNSRSSPLWKAIDTNGDGILEENEIADSAHSLRLRDDNEDEMLSGAEVQETEAGTMTTNVPRRLRGKSSGAAIGSFTDWTPVQLAMEQHYALGISLTKENFQQAAVFEHLDENGNGQIDRKEFSRLQTCPATFKLRLDLDGAGQEGSPWTVVESTSDSAINVQSCPGGVMLDLAGSKVKLVLNDTVGQSNYEQQAAQLVMQYDGDANGYLEKEEIPEAAATMIPFAAVDTNQDGKVYPAEVAELLERQQGAMRCQVHAKGTDRTDAFFAWLDENANERLEPREIDGAAERLKKLMPEDGSGVHGDQIPAAMLVVFARGNLENADALFVAPAVIEAVAADQPAWFIGMDANRDGALSRREFIGEESQFDEWDANQDNYLTLDELPKETAADKPAEEPAP